MKKFKYPGKNNENQFGTRHHNYHLFNKYYLLGFSFENALNNYDIHDMLYVLYPAFDLSIGSENLDLKL